MSRMYTECFAYWLFRIRIWIRVCMYTYNWIIKLSREKYNSLALWIYLMCQKAITPCSFPKHFIFLWRRHQKRSNSFNSLMVSFWHLWGESSVGHKTPSLSVWIQCMVKWLHIEMPLYYCVVTQTQIRLIAEFLYSVSGWQWESSP